MSKIKSEPTDSAESTFIILGCRGPAHRLHGILKVFERSLSLAATDDNDEWLANDLLRLYDQGDRLHATWRTIDGGRDLHRYVDSAWAEEGKACSIHSSLDGEVICKISA